KPGIQVSGTMTAFCNGLNMNMHKELAYLDDGLSGGFHHIDHTLRPSQARGHTSDSPPYRSPPSSPSASWSRLTLDHRPPPGFTAEEPMQVSICRKNMPSLRRTLSVLWRVLTHAPTAKNPTTTRKPGQAHHSAAVRVYPMYPLMRWAAPLSNVPSVEHWKRRSEEVWEQTHQRIEDAIHQHKQHAD
ncbi:hypothetical protein NFI96_031450, partial [Prochilodus magdalenae]